MSNALESEVAKILRHPDADTFLFTSHAEDQSRRERNIPADDEDWDTGDDLPEPDYVGHLPDGVSPIGD